MRFEKLLRTFLNTFPALRYRNFQLYFVGQLISLIGIWLQAVAQGWLVFQITHSAFMLGLIAAIGSLPILIFSLFGGVIVDRFPKRRILLFTQSASMILAFILGILTVFGIINVLEIGILAFLLGTVVALDMPTRQSFMIEIVGKKDLPSAIALGAGIFNSARIIGPAMAGFLILLVGTGGVFLINAVSYIAVIIAIFYIKGTTLQAAKIHQHPLKEMVAGLKYSFNHSTIQMLLIFVAITSIFGSSYSTMMPYVVQNVFHRGAETLGFLNAAGGVGAVLGVILVSGFAAKVKNSIFILGGNLILAISILLFTLAPNLGFGLFFLFLAGFGFVMQFSMTNTTIQGLVADSFRGRVMSIYSLMFMGISPLGNFQIGILSEKLGVFWAMRLGAFIILIFGLWLFFRRRRMELNLHKVEIQQ